MAEVQGWWLPSPTHDGCKQQQAASRGQALEVTSCSAELHKLKQHKHQCSCTGSINALQRTSSDASHGGAEHKIAVLCWNLSPLEVASPDPSCVAQCTVLLHCASMLCSNKIQWVEIAENCTRCWTLFGKVQYFCLAPQIDWYQVTLLSAHIRHTDLHCSTFSLSKVNNWLAQMTHL